MRRERLFASRKPRREFIQDNALEAEVDA